MSSMNESVVRLGTSELRREIEFVRWSVHGLEILALKFCDHNPSFHKISSLHHTDLQVEEAAHRPF